MPRLLAFACLLPGLCAAADLNRIAIHYQYSDGDFPAVIRSIDAFTQRRKAWSRDDSLFIAKHLGVVYAANPDTRELGRYHMVRLLELEPAADLSDMYVSDEIHEVFQRVRKENEARIRESAARAEAERKAHAPLWKKPWAWAAGSAAVAGVTVAILLWPEGKPRPEYAVP
jgi:hypothetical protein